MRRLPSAPATIVAAFPAAALVAVASLAGLLVPATYVRETPNWQAQAIGQDWFDLLFAVPWLAISAAMTLRGSARALPLLAGGLLYTIYEFVIYAFSVHFNSLFLVYCAALGLSFFALLGIAVSLVREPTAPRWTDLPHRTVASFFIAVAAIFTLAWLGEIIPASIAGTTPQSLVDAGLPTNPVYVMDLAVVLPAHFMVGIALRRGEPAGVTLAPILLAFDALMAASIAGMMLVMRARGIATSIVVTSLMAAVAAGSAGLLVRTIRTPAEA